MLIAIGIRDDDVLHVASAVAQHLVHGRASIGAEVEAICHLNRLRCVLPSSLGIRTSTVADDDLDAGMGAQPVGEDFGGAIVEQVNGPVCFKVEQQGSIPAVLLSQRQVIDTQHPRAMLFAVVAEAMQQVKQRIWADGYACLASQASATLAAGLQRERG
jgi:hypothetical protein